MHRFPLTFALVLLAGAPAVGEDLEPRRPQPARSAERPPGESVGTAHFARDGARTADAEAAVQAVGHVEPVCDAPPCDEWDGACDGGNWLTAQDLLGGGNWMEDNGFSVRGWLQQGFTGYPDSPSNNFIGPTTFGQRRWFNDRANEYMLNQLYLIGELRADRDPDEWGAGGRIDLLYGTDYFFVTALGLETERDGTQRWNTDDGPRGADTYGLAMPQLYAEFYAPLGEGLSVKMGHFYSILGYEQVAAPENFFYSRSYTMQYGRPLTHTGMLATYRATEQIFVNAGFTRGWDNWEDTNNDLAVLGGIGWTHPDEIFALYYAFHDGNEGRGAGSNRFVNTFVAKARITDRLHYVFEHGFGHQDKGAVDEQFNLVSANWYSFANYLFYEISNEFALGGRFEIFRDEDNSRILQLPFDRFVNGRDYYQLTFGGNWRPHQSLIVRPEIRWDWSNVESGLFDIGGPFDDAGSDSQFTLGTDVILTY